MPVPPLTLVLSGAPDATGWTATLDSLAAQRDVTLQVIAVTAPGGPTPPPWSHRVDLLLVEPAPGAVARRNRGLAAATGEWILFLEAGERLVGDLILSEVLAWTRRTEAGVLGGEVAWDHGRLARLRAPVNAARGDFTPRAATVYRRSLFEENGPFDPAFPLRPGYEFHARLWKNRVRFKPIPLRLTAAPGGGTGEGSGWSAAREEIRIRHAYFRPWRCLLPDLGSLVRALRPAR